MKRLALILTITLASCGTPAGISTANFLESPATANIISMAASIGAASLVASAGKKLDPTQQQALIAAASAAASGVGTGTVWAIGEALRTKQGTAGAASPASLAPVIVSQAGAPIAVSLPVATAVSALQATGVSSDKANEAVAVTVQAVAAQKKL